MGTYDSEMAPAAFDLCGGHPVLDFVNSLDNRFDPARSKDRLSDYGALLRFAGESGLLGPLHGRAPGKAVSSAIATRVLRSARELREALSEVLYAAAEQHLPTPAALGTLERRLHEAETPRQLQWARAGSGAGTALQWQWSAEQANKPEFVVWLIAEAASQLMLSDALARVRACEAGTCRWLFLDNSKNHTRRWCNMKVCGNRAKARRFQERRTQ
jgi:predicted RNA-binding Zn ribbon-like protein